ncbi:hypothetical protein CCH79_00011105 [Gambusia affinis]|uniref:Nucleoside diphosphate kinase B n=1 Tax=Gambusia affinis TaxID=33528 RepID=A0A315UT67_GAMAF|nr:hypothetical protein CCH79_00011105 [Gambusia affinis]
MEEGSVRPNGARHQQTSVPWRKNIDTALRFVTRGESLHRLFGQMNSGHQQLSGLIAAHVQVADESLDARLVRCSRDDISAAEEKPVGEDRYAFLAEWYDPTAALLRRYQLFFYPKDNSVEMFELKHQRMFLRRIKYEDLHLEDLFLGNRVTVFSRQLKLIDYGDQFTANKLGSRIERTFALVKPDVLNKIGDIFELIHSAKLIVTKAKMTRLTWSQAADFYVEHQSKPYFNNLIQFITSGPVVAMELTGDEAMCIWRVLLGPPDSAVARQEAPQSIRAKFGTDAIQNVCHGSESLAAAARVRNVSPKVTLCPGLHRPLCPLPEIMVNLRLLCLCVCQELEFFFPSTVGPGLPNSAVCEDSTCCIIKPHAITEGLTGKILNSIHEARFKISALEMFNVNHANAEEFYEIYKGVVMEYPSMVSELCSGPCIVLEIQGADIPKSFRELCGPSDPEIARHLRPNTLRGLYGKDKVRNAVHCTDLPEDGVLETPYATPTRFHQRDCSHPHQ